MSPAGLGRSSDPARDRCHSKTVYYRLHAYNDSTLSPMRGPGRLHPVTVDAISLLGQQVRLGRTQRRWTVSGLAERLGVSPVTLRKVERGDPTVALGTAFEAATLVGVPLFEDPERRQAEQSRVAAHLAALPASVRPAVPSDDDF